MFKLSLNKTTSRGGGGGGGGSGDSSPTDAVSPNSDATVAAPIKPPKSPLRSTALSLPPSSSSKTIPKHPLAEQQRIDTVARPIPAKYSSQPTANAAEATGQSAVSSSTSSNTITSPASTSAGDSSAVLSWSSLRRLDNQGQSASTTSSNGLGAASSSHLSVSAEARRKRAPSDASTGMQATASWFAGSATDDDDDDDDDDDGNSTPASPTESSWPAAASVSLLERAKDALVLGSISGLPGVMQAEDEKQEDIVGPLPSSRSLSGQAELGKLGHGDERGDEHQHQLPQTQQQRRFGEASPSQLNSRRAATLPTSESNHRNLATPPRSSSVSSPQEQAKLARSPSKLYSGGILGRLKRISKKEKRGTASLDTGMRPEPVPSVASPTLTTTEEHAEPTNLANTTTGDASTTSSWDQGRHQADLPIRDASRARTPQFGVERVQSIHSVQPSLVDDESIAGRDSPRTSPFEIDDDEIDWVAQSDAQPITPSDEVKEGSVVAPVEADVTIQGQAEADADDEWHMQSLPGSFFVDPNVSSNATGTPSKSRGLHSASNGVPEHIFTPPLINLIESTPDTMNVDAFVVDSNNAIPTINVDPALGQTRTRTPQPSEYAEALSRQTSDDSTMETSNKNYLDPSSQADDQDDDAATPRAVTETDRTSYFDVPPQSTPVASPAVAATATATATATASDQFPLRHADSWLDKAKLAQEERHYLIRHLVTQQMVWESKRLFLVQRAADLFAPSPPEALPTADTGYLKAHPGQFVPNLPISRLLVRHILMTCPFFSSAVPIEGAAAERARATGATRFLDEGVLPLVRFLHSRAISQAVDLNGEWPEEMFDAPSTLDMMSSSVFRLLARFVSALADGRGHGFLWTKIPVPDRASFFAHRTTLTKLKQGGMEVNVVGSRLRALSRECELILSVRRYGFPPAYVIRTESDFYQYARSLAEELGPQARVRPVPAPDVEFTSLPTLDEQINPRSNTSSPSFIGVGGSSKPSSLHSGAISPASPTSRAAAIEQENTAIATNERPKPTRLTSNDSLARVGSQNMSSNSLASAASARRRSMDGSSSSSSSSSKSPLSPSALMSPRDRSSSRGIFSPSARLATTAQKSSSMIDLSTLGRGSAAAATTTPITIDEEARRRQLRTWLRDTLSIRGAGHAKQTMSFLLNDSFLDRDLKPASRKDVQSRLDVDEAAMRDRERIIDDAPREVAELRREMAQMWRECIDGDGFERALHAVQQHATFSSLPLAYQRFISWTNLQIAAFLHHTFLDSHEARANFDRLQEIVSAVPWRLLSVALRERTGWMMQKVQAALTEDFVQKKVLAVLLQDEPAKKLEEELVRLRTRLGSTVMRKLEVFVQSSAWQKSIVRRAARQADIPLVSAIMRGSDRPLLSSEGIKKVTTATRAYQEYTNTQPTYAERKAKLKASIEVRLIYDMQRALRLLAQQRDGKEIREALAKELKPALAALTAPLLDLLRRLHRTRLLLGRRNSTASMGSSASSSGEQHGAAAATAASSGDMVVELQQFCFRLLDVLAGLRMRVQDPWRSLSTLTLVLDDVVPTWYQRLHGSSLADSLLHDVTLWLQSVASLLRFRGSNGEAGADDLLSRFWPKPPSTSAGSGTSATKPASSSSSSSSLPPLQPGQPDRIAMEALVEAAWYKRSRQMQTGCRWAAGEADAELDVQLMGEGGKTRTTPYEMPKQKRGPSPKVQAGLDRLLPGFRSALDHVLTADPGTAW